MSRHARILTGRIEPAFLAAALAWVQGLVGEFGIDDDDAYRLELCCEELVLNTLNYAEPAYRGTRFDISAEIEPDGMALEFIDGAQPFDPLARPVAKEVPAAIEDFAIGGKGITLVRDSSDACTYYHQDGKNRLGLRFDFAVPLERLAPHRWKRRGPGRRAPTSCTEFPLMRANGEMIPDETRSSPERRIRGFLSLAEMFKGVPFETLEDIVAPLPVQQFAADTVLLNPGDINSNALLVLAGTIQIRIGAGDNSEVIEIGAGGCAGEMSVIDGSPVSAQVIATDGTRLLLVDKASFIEKLMVLPAVSRNLMHALSDRMRRSNAQTVRRIRIEAEMAQVHRELAMAKEIQQSLLPKEPMFPDEPRVECAGRMRTAKEVGGDFYDAFFLDDDHLFFVVGDVCGKGLPASLFMVRAISALRAQTGSNYLDPGYIPEVTARLNQQLCAYNDKQQFLTAFCGIVHIGTGEIRFVNAGHNPPLVSDADGDFRYLEEPINPIIGMIGGLAYRPGEVILPPGGTLLLFTDGVTEAESASALMYGEERLLALADTASREHPRELVRRVVASVEGFVGNAPQSDDITVLAIRRR